MSEIFDEAKPLVELFRKSVLAAVEAERGRLAAAMLEAKEKAALNADYPLAAALRDCIDAIRKPEAEKPPPPEPMTIATIIETLREGRAVLPTAYQWRDVEKDLAAFVDQATQAQARRDAEVCERLAAAGSSDNDSWILACQVCNELILKAAGTLDSSSKADAAIQKLREDRRLTREELDRPMTI